MPPPVPPGMWFDRDTWLILPQGVRPASKGRVAASYALAIGLFNAGSNVGAVVAPLIVPAITLAMGWQMAFILTGLLTVIWLAAWLAFYRRPEKHRAVSAAELAYIQSDPAPAQTPVPWRRLLTTRETWAYMAGRFLIDPVWWTFLFWLPDFFTRRYGVDMTAFGPPLVVISFVKNATTYTLSQIFATAFLHSKPAMSRVSSEILHSNLRTLSCMM